MVRLGLVAVLVAATIACADGEPAAERTSVAPTVAGVPDATPATVPETSPTVDTATTSTSSARSTTPAADAAPDFSLRLGNGGTFVLSEEARPVFLVFWAEW